MDKVYYSKLHKFVKGYFDAQDAKIVQQQDNFFIVEFPDGLKKTYTYIAKIAAENKDISLLAKGSKALNDMITECALRAAFSEVYISYNTESVKASLSHKDCCDLCPFFTICKYKNKCCDFCSYYKICNTNLVDADFIALGDIKESKPLNIICFVFFVELSNDYSLSQKIEKLVPILIDWDTNKIIGKIKIDDLISLDVDIWDKSFSLDEKKYQHFMNTARQEAYETIKNQLEVFKKEIEGTLKDKISSIINKYEEEYRENYTKVTLKQLEKLQEEALKLCEREIRGYSINCDYRIENVILIHTTKDIRNLLFKSKKTDTEALIQSEIFLNNVTIGCLECNSEIDTGTICSKGHAICDACMEICSACGRIICAVCDDESYICSTCGEIVCSDCVMRCTLCNTVLCPSHSYRCITCGKVYCIDCYEICDICENSICSSHAHQCYHCKNFVCSEHIHKCSVCNESFCDKHILRCSICDKGLCEVHAVKSSYSGRTVCVEHLDSCSVCGKVFALDELKKCIICGAMLCPDHSKICSNCSRVYCSEHINHCNSCGKDYCSCTHRVRCKLCKGTYCPDCIDSNGLCRACSNLVQIDKITDIPSTVLEEVANYRKYYLGKACEINILYAKNIFTGTLVMFDNNGEILNNKSINILEFLKRKLFKD